MKSKTEKIFIIDAVNYLFRSYYAIGPMTNDKGQSTSALFGFIRSVQKLITDFSPDYIVCVFDGPDNKKSRQTLYAEYKMHRKGAPEDLFPQFEMAYEFCNLSGISTLCVEGVEADDTMASVSKWAKEKEGLEVYLCTSDKDLFQLVEKDVYIVLPHKNNMLVDREKVNEIFGVYPEQMLDYLAIVGDTSDNIPGLPGFGPKTAVELLHKFKNLDDILKHPEKVSGAKKQETLINEQDKALLSKELATLNLKIDIPHKKDFYRKKPTEIQALSDFYQKMNFQKFRHDLQAELVKEPIQATFDLNMEEPSSSEHHHSKKDKHHFKKETEEKPEFSLPKEEVDYRLVNNEEKFHDLLKHLLKEKEICIDTETTSILPIEASLIGIGFCIKPKNGWYVPLNGMIDEKVIIDSLKDFFHKSEAKFIGHNIKYDLQVLANYDIFIKKIGFDTIIASYLIAPQHKRHNLDYLSLENFNKVKISYKDLTTSDGKKILLKNVPVERVASYCCEDVDYTMRLKELFEKNIESLHLGKIFYDMEMPLIFILAGMERKGIYLDVSKFEKLNKDLTAELSEIEKEIYKEAGHEVNLNSPKQLSDLLYKKLKLPLPARQKTEYSTGAEVLEKLALEHKIVEKILKHRTLGKLLSTYVEALPKQINPQTGRIHPTFNQSVAATGRLSCQDPNLQNIPVKTKEGKKIREGFKPEKKGWSFVDADYSQIELRLLAHLSKDSELIRAFNNNEDIHSYTASLVFKTDIKHVTPEMRRIAKVVNFGTIYGQGPFGLSQLLNIPFKEANEFIKTYFERYTSVESFLEKCKKDALEKKFAETLFGRIRPIPEIDNKNPTIRAAAQRLAINTPLQGTAADIIKLAMIDIDKEIKKEKLEGFMILQIHDELMFEVPDNEIVVFKELVKKKMENVVKLKVPLIVDLQVGKNWGEC